MKMEKFIQTCCLCTWHEQVLYYSERLDYKKFGLNVVSMVTCLKIILIGCNPKQKNTDGFTPRLLAKEKSFKEASKELRKAERAFAKFSKPEAVNPNDPEILRYYDWICEKEAYVKEVLTNSAVSYCKQQACIKIVL